MAQGDIYGNLAGSILGVDPSAIGKSLINGYRAGLESQHMAMQQRQQAFQMQQQQQAFAMQQAQYQDEQKQQMLKNKSDAVKQILSAETPQGVEAVGKIYGDAFNPEQHMAIMEAARAFQQKQLAEAAGMKPVAPGMPPPEGARQVAGQPYAYPVQSKYERGGSGKPDVMLTQRSPFVPPVPMLVPGTQPAAGGGQPSAGTRDILWAGNVMANPDKFQPHEQAAAKELMASSALTDDAKDMAVDWLLKTGQMMPGLNGFGMNKAKLDVINQVADATKVLGLSPMDVMANGAELAANKGSLANLAKMQTGIEAFSKFTDTQLDLLDNLLTKAEKTTAFQDSKLLNKPVTAWGKNISSTPEMQAYLQQLLSARSEVARLVTQAGLGSAALTVTAMQDWEKVLSESSTPAQVRAFISTAKKEISGRKKAFDLERKEIRDRILKGGSTVKGKALGDALNQEAPAAQAPSDTEDQMNRIQQLLDQFDKQ